MTASDISHRWLSDLSELRKHETPCVLITVVTAKGSTPRKSGTKMIVTQFQQFGTIGGGNLEFEAIAAARKLLAEAADTPEIHDYALGPSLAQCCGGAVTILLEPFLANGKTLILFGAGHVGKEIIKVLDGLPVKIKWVDERANEFPQEMPGNVEKIITAAPAEELKNLAEDVYILVITHSHDLDYTIVEQALSRNKFTYLGLIGSDTKRAKFNKRLKADGINAKRLADLTCPIGVEGVKGKHPREIAIAVAAELLQNGLVASAAKQPAENGKEERNKNARTA
ncbi:MAG: xanthine dehydrogenase accessory protein XdhC [Alphaproteobacteria bacterium]|nr:MAG: xanthine dehydrogenase accessory protein XdhC [Alphaproteobacteria bacterium]